MVASREPVCSNGSQPFTSHTTAVAQYPSATFSGQTGAESVLPDPTNLGRLVLAFHVIDRFPGEAEPRTLTVESAPSITYRRSSHEFLSRSTQRRFGDCRSCARAFATSASPGSSSKVWRKQRSASANSPISAITNPRCPKAIEFSGFRRIAV